MAPGKETILVSRMKKNIESYVKSWVVCAAMKERPGNPPGLLQQAAEPSQPWEEIAMDFVVELPDSRTI